MAKFAPVAPIRILEQLDKQELLGDYHLLLAHDVIAHPINKELYRQTFAQRNWDGVVILDNSVIELGTAVNLDIIAEAQRLTRANVIVLPDVLEDAAGTVESIRANIKDWIRKFDNPELIRFMLVPQGKTLEQFEACAQEIWNIAFEAGAPDIMWGLPRNLVKLHGSRKPALKALRAIDDTIDVHMLGFSDDSADDIDVASYAEGIDSAVPIRCAALGMSYAALANGNVGPLPPRGDWWDTARWMPLMADNLLEAREIYNG